MIALIVFLGVISICGVGLIIIRSRLYRVTDEDILLVIDYEWRKISEIHDRIIRTYSNEHGSPLPYYRASTLRMVLEKLKDEGNLESKLIEGDPEKYISDYVVYRRCAGIGRVNKTKTARVAQTNTLTPLLALPCAFFLSKLIELKAAHEGGFRYLL